MRLRPRRRRRRRLPRPSASRLSGAIRGSEAHVPHEQRSLCRPEAGGAETHREHGEERLHLWFPVEARERAGKGDARRREQRPIATLVQKTVDRSRSVRTRRWISAVPSALSVNTTTNPEKTSVIAASPQSCGVSIRARTSATTSRDPCRISWDATFHATPLTTRLRSPSGQLTDVSLTPCRLRLTCA